FEVTLVNRSIEGEQFNWNLGDGTTSDEESTFTHVYTTQGTYLITLTATDPNTCEVRDVVSKSISIFGDAVTVSGDVAICRGSSTRISAFGGSSYEWRPRDGLNDPFSSRPIASPVNTTNYKVLITTPNGCLKEDSLVVTVNETIEESFEIVPRYSCDQFTYGIANETNYEGDILWDFGDGTVSTERNPTHTYENPGTYTVNLLLPDADCFVDESRVIVHEDFFVPNVFTPNNDGVNDFFEVKTNIEVGMKVFNRAGYTHFETDNYQNDWDGGNLPSGIYYYQLSFPDEETCRGWVQLLR
ncbi:MAG: PKD domain-containing protein, partial [Bacteroidota bacterium]